MMAEVDIAARHGGRDYPIRGHCDPQFQRVLDAFAANFAQGEEIGACVAVMRAGKTVVDLWGGFADRACTRPWQRDTLVNMMSVSKVASAVCTHMLIERGVLDPDAPVVR